MWLKLIHSYLTWWWQPSWILSSWILPSLIQPFCTKLWIKLIHSHSTWRCQPSWILPLGFNHFEQKKLHSFILTQLEDGSHLEFYHIGFSHFAQKNFTHSFWLYLMMAAILNSAMLGFSHCHLGFRHLVIFSQIHSETLSLHSDSDSN